MIRTVPHRHQTHIFCRNSFLLIYISFLFFALVELIYTCIYIYIYTYISSLSLSSSWSHPNRRFFFFFFMFHMHVGRSRKTSTISTLVSSFLPLIFFLFAFSYPCVNLPVWVFGIELEWYDRYPYLCISFSFFLSFILSDVNEKKISIGFVPRRIDSTLWTVRETCRTIEKYHREKIRDEWEKIQRQNINDETVRFQ